MKLKLYRPSVVRSLSPMTEPGALLHGVLNVLERDVVNRCPVTPIALEKDAIFLTIVEEDDLGKIEAMLSQFVGIYLKKFPRENGTDTAVLFILPNVHDKEGLRQARIRIAAQWPTAPAALGIFELGFDMLLEDQTMLPVQVLTVAVRHIVGTDWDLAMKQTDGYPSDDMVTIFDGLYPGRNYAGRRTGKPPQPISIYQPEQILRLPKYEFPGNWLDATLRVVAQDAAKECPFIPGALANNSIWFGLMDARKPEDVVTLLDPFHKEFLTHLQTKHNKAVVFCLPNYPLERNLHKFPNFRHVQAKCFLTGVMLGFMPMTARFHTDCITVEKRTFMSAIMRDMVETDWTLIVQQLGGRPSDEVRASFKRRFPNANV